MAIIRLIAVVVAVEALFYVLIFSYVRSLRREQLEEEWDRRHPDAQGDSVERDKFVRRSMLGYRRTLRARLVGLVFIVPTLVIIAIIYFVNYN